MKRIPAIVLLLAAAGLLAATTGCASSSSDSYYRRGGSIHRDAFPPGYVPGRHGSYRYGRPGW